MDEVHDLQPFLKAIPAQLCPGNEIWKVFVHALVSFNLGDIKAMDQGAAWYGS